MKPEKEPNRKPQSLSPEPENLNPKHKTLKSYGELMDPQNGKTGETYDRSS